MVRDVSLHSHQTMMPGLLSQVLGHPVGAKVLQTANETSQSSAGTSAPHIHQAAGQPTASVNVLLQHLRRESLAGHAEMAVATALRDVASNQSQVQ